MKADTFGALSRVLAFAGQVATDEEIRRAVTFADFAQLRQQELDKGFREAPRPRPGGNFFRRGEMGAWRDELTAEQVARIESEHAPMMQRLGYELSSIASLACAG
jgi:hypothetical protein